MFNTEAVSDVDVKVTMVFYVRALTCMMLLGGLGSATYQDFFMEDQCPTHSVQMSTQASRVYLTRADHYSSGLNCRWNIHSPAPGPLIVTFQWLDIARHGRECGDDFLRIYDGTVDSGHIIAGPVCGWPAWPQSYTLSSGILGIWMVSGKRYPTRKGFQIILTAAHPGLCSSGRHFRCRNTLCIDAAYTCDGLNNCGDNSDETSANCSGRLYPAAITGIVIGGLAVIFTVMFLMVLAIHRKMKSSAPTQTNRIVFEHPVTIVLPTDNLPPPVTTTSTPDGGTVVPYAIPTKTSSL